MMRLGHEASRYSLDLTQLFNFSVVVVHDEALTILVGLTASAIHLVIAPASLVELAIASLKNDLAVSDALLVFTLILVSAKVESDSEAIPGSLVEHALVAESVLE
jgi:hypothetical protein